MVNYIHLYMNALQIAFRIFFALAICMAIGYTYYQTVVLGDFSIENFQAVLESSPQTL